MIDLTAFHYELRALRQEMEDLGMPYGLTLRVDAVQSIIPNIERAREQRK